MVKVPFLALIVVCGFLCADRELKPNRMDNETRSESTRNERPGQMWSAKRTIYVTWMVKDTEKFFEKPSSTAPGDKKVDLGLTYAEWNAIFIQALGETSTVRVKDFDLNTVVEFEPISGYPLLSRMGSVLEDAIYEEDEILQLKDECIRALGEVHGPVAQLGLNKLITLCDDASSSHLALYFLAD